MCVCLCHEWGIAHEHPVPRLSIQIIWVCVCLCEAYLYICMYAPAQEWTNRTPNATNKSIPHFLVLPGSESSFTEITEYIYFSLI